MGMHFGVIAASASSEALLSALSVGINGWRRVSDVSSLNAVPDRAGEEPPLVAGDLRGVGYVMDPGLLVSTNADAIVEASRVLNALVGTIGAETTSGTYWLTVADRGSLSRLHWNSLWGQVEPYDVGTALPSEAAGPLEDVDGVGLLRVFHALGFDFELWSSSGPFAVLEVDYRIGEPGPVGAAQNAFAAAHPIGDPNPTPVVVQRGNGEFDMVAAGSRLPDGTIVQAPPPKKSGLLGRLPGR